MPKRKRRVGEIFIGPGSEVLVDKQEIAIAKKRLADFDKRFKAKYIKPKV